MSLKDEIKNKFIYEKLIDFDLVYKYVSSKTFNDYLREAIDRELIWRKEFDKNKNKILDSINSRKDKNVEGVDVIIDDKKEDKKDNEVKQSKVVTDFKKLHEKIKRIMDDIVAIYSLYGERLEESSDNVARYTKMILEDIKSDVSDIKKIIDFCDEIDYDIYCRLMDLLDNAIIFLVFIKE